jgi:hypothetical protein
MAAPLLNYRIVQNCLENWVNVPNTAFAHPIAIGSPSGVGIRRRSGYCRLALPQATQKRVMHLSY